MAPSFTVVLARSLPFCSPFHVQWIGWSGGCIACQKLERKINRGGNAHVHTLLHCLFKYQYQYLDREPENENASLSIWQLFMFHLMVYIWLKMPPKHESAMVHCASM